MLKIICKNILVVFVIVVMCSFQLEKKLLAESVDSSNDNSSIYFEADNLYYDNDGNNITAEGNAKLFYKTYIVEANKITYIQDIDQVIASGSVTMTEKGEVQINAERIMLSNQLKQGFIESVKIVLNDGTKIRSESGDVDFGNKNIFKNAGYTFCNDMKDGETCPYTWEFEADVVTHDEQNKKFVFQNIKFKLFDKTLLKLPYFSYPDLSVKRQSGYLLPTYSFSNFYGHSVKIPYLFVLDDTSDVTITPFLTSKQGPLIDLEYRKVTDTGGKISLNPSFIYQANPMDIAPGNKRFRAGLKTNAYLPISDNVNWGWNATFASDDTYMRKYGLDDRTKYNSNLFLSGTNSQNYINLQAISFHNLLSDSDTRQAKLLPQLDYEYKYNNLPFMGQVNLDAQISSLHRNSGDDQTRLTTEISWEDRNIMKNGVVFEPYIGLKGDYFSTYDESDNEFTDHSRFTPEAAIETSWPFFQNSSIGKQIIEPKLSYSYIGKEDTDSDLLNEDSRTINFNSLNLFETNRSYGYDKIDSGNKMSIGLGYDLQDRLGGLFSASIGKSFHLDGDNTYSGKKYSGTNNYHSDIVSSLSYNLNDSLQFDYKTRFDGAFKKNQFNELNINFHNKKSLNLGLNYTEIKADANWLNDDGNDNNDVDLEEMSGYLEFGLTRDWSMISKGVYNLESNNFLNNQIGLRFDDECLSFDIVYRENLFTDRDIKKDKSILLNFELKTAPIQ